MIPIIIMNRDKLEVLRNCIFRLPSSKVKIYIHDNASTYKPLLEYYNDLEAYDICVIYNKKNDFCDSLQSTIDLALKETGSDYYVVTDSDIGLITNDDTLEVMQSFLDNTNHECVGTMLEIYDLPDTPNLDFQKRTHWEQFWHKTPIVGKWKHIPVLYQEAYIDTTFAMYRKTFKFHRLTKGIRLYYPFSARHLDWYIDFKNPPEDHKYYMEHCDKNVATFAKEMTE